MAETCFGLRGVDTLRHELDRARESLRDTDATIEKLTGRPVTAGNRPFIRRPPPIRPGDEAYSAGRIKPGDEAYSAGRVAGNNSLFSLAGYDASGPPSSKRFAGMGGPGTFGRLGLPVGGPRQFPPRRQRDDDDDDELPHKPTLQSSVVATPKDTKSREEAIAEQQSGAGGEVGAKRNRRMFGMILGTLVKFREDERTKEEQAGKRKEVEERLEQKQRDERDRLVRERQQLFVDRRNHQIKLRALEQKMELVEIHEAWEAETHNLEYFIRTSARPHVFYLPKTHIPASAAKLEESKRILQEIVKERRRQLEEEIEEIMSRNDHGKEGGEDEEGEEVGSGNEDDNSMEVDKQQKGKNKPQTEYPESDLEEDTGVDVDCVPITETAVTAAPSAVENAEEGSEIRRSAKDRLGVAEDPVVHEEGEITDKQGQVGDLDIEQPARRSSRDGQEEINHELRDSRDDRHDSSRNKDSKVDRRDSGHGKDSKADRHRDNKSSERRNRHRGEDRDRHRHRRNSSKEGKHRDRDRHESDRKRGRDHSQKHESKVHHDSDDFGNEKEKDKDRKHGSGKDKKDRDDAKDEKKAEPKKKHEGNDSESGETNKEEQQKKTKLDSD